MLATKLIQMEDNALEELAVEEILKDLKRGAERAKEHGALGWQKNPAPAPNKRFLRNMLVSTLRDDRPLNFRRQFEKYSAKYKETSRDYYDFKLSQKDKLERKRMHYEDCESDTEVSYSKSHHRSRSSGKRMRESSSESGDEKKKNAETKNAKRHKKHRRKTPKKDSDYSGQKKHKKSKKSKKHKSKKSSHHVKDKS